MRFCELCNNMLYPRENRRSKTLEFYCKQQNCGYVKTGVQESCVFSNELIKDSSLVTYIVSSLPLISIHCFLSFLLFIKFAIEFFSLDHSTRLEVINSDLNRVCEFCCRCDNSSDFITDLFSFLPGPNTSAHEGYLLQQLWSPWGRLLPGSSSQFIFSFRRIVFKV